VLRLHDTATFKKAPLQPRDPGRLSLYVCGPTVYDAPHVGHGRQILVYDVLRRYLEWTGLEVRHVSNVTDVDDKIIERAREERRSTDEIAALNEAQWWESADRLGALRPTVAPHASEYVARMVEVIGQLAERGYAYAGSDGMYLAAELVDGYGLLAHQPLSTLRAGARVEVAEDKRSPVDFALWKRAKEGEPAWDSPFGPGRPGWHTECVAMSLDLLDDDFDLHAGGLELAFPHHENERAQAVALGRPFARHWMHHGMVELGGEKMSKSLGNVVSLPELLDRADDRALRLLVLQSHYRSPMEVGEREVAQAEEALSRLDYLARRFSLPASPAESGEGVDEEAVARFVERMEDDLDTPAALALIFELVKEANSADDAGERERGARAARTVAHLARVVGLFLRPGSDDHEPEVEAMVGERDRARAAGDFATADALRDELRSRGYVVEDTPAGTRLVRPGGLTGPAAD
jgi:cysteinyl-tRNA synthetase